ncbi:molybdopterin molybdotransferase MoeA, partial [Patulibacter sp. NPDC049589]|uniref:molybdopterin molybdotransferase MoeA n=1 Tax=Patulibacter sp. NPDC049589 TaxID=3154731 RepID=UPI00341CBCB7
GRPADVAVLAGGALRISTGARLPAGADAVVRVEDAEAVGGEDVEAVGGEGAVAVRVAVDPGRDVRRAGEDVAPGDVAVRAGERLHLGHVALLAGLGATVVACRRRPRALVVVTGDEVAATGDAPGDGGIHDVGGPALAALLRASGADVLAVRHAGDDRDGTIAAFSDHDADLVISSGGVSVGPHDHVRGALAALGADERIAGLALQPGRPTWLGSVPGEHGPRPVLALPGNPGAAITVAALLLPPLLGGMTGRAPAAPLRARLTAATHGDARRVRALRVALGEDADGGRTATVLQAQQPHRLASFPATTAFALLPAADGPLPAGAVVEVVVVPAGA